MQPAIVCPLLPPDARMQRAGGRSISNNLFNRDICVPHSTNNRSSGVLLYDDDTRVSLMLKIRSSPLVCNMPPLHMATGEKDQLAPIARRVVDCSIDLPITHFKFSVARLYKSDPFNAGSAWSSIHEQSGVN